jgi:iduronate 2-sulfatase
LDQFGFSNDTIVVFLGDHGFHIGEHNIWGKYDNFEISARAPLIIKAPCLKLESGIVYGDVIELLDLFPTLVELAGLPPIPTCPWKSSHVKTCTEGQSLIPLIQGNARFDSTEHGIAFWQYPRMLLPGEYTMGYTVCTKQYRYTEWVRYDYITLAPDWSIMPAVELYDHYSDPEESRNVAMETKYQHVVKHLRVLLRNRNS